MIRSRVQPDTAIAAGLRLGPAVEPLPPPGAEDALRVRALLLAGVAAISRGIARRARDMAFDYARERRQGGVPIVEHDAVADLLTGIQLRLRPCCGDLGSAGAARPAKDRLDAAITAKVADGDAAVAVTIDAVQVFGGLGYMHETGVEKLMRDAKYCQLYPEPSWRLRRELLADRQPAAKASRRSMR